MKKTTSLFFSKQSLQQYSFTSIVKNVFQSKKMLLTIIGMIALLSSYATDYTATVTGNWSNAATWGGAGVPGAGDNATINSGITVTVTAAASVTDISINGTLTLSADLTVAGAWALNTGATFTPNANAVTFTGGSIGGDLPTTFTSLIINTTNTTDVVSVLTSGITIKYSNGTGGTLTLSNGIFNIGTGNVLYFNNNSATNGLINNGGNLATSNNGKDGGEVVLLNGSGSNFNITGTGSTTFYDLSFGTAVGAGNRNVNQSAPVLINGTLTMQDNQSKWSTGSPAYGPNATLYVNGNGQGYTPGSSPRLEWLAVAPGTGIIGSTVGYPNNVTIVNVGGSVNNGDGFSPNGGSWSINGTLAIGDGTTSAKADVLRMSAFSCGGVTIDNNSKLSGSSFSVTGNWLQTGATQGIYANSGTGTITFDGSGTSALPQTITAAGSLNTFDNITIGNGVTNTYVKLNTGVILPANATLILASGIVETTPADIIDITNTSTTAVSGGSTTSYINGPLEWSLASENTYAFPLGAATTYLPLTLNGATSAAIVTAQAFNTASGGTTDGTLSTLSTTEYWSLATSSSLAGSSVSVARQTPIIPFIYIAESTTGAAGQYTSIGGIDLVDGINTSKDIGSGLSLFFALGAPPIVSTLPATSITTTSATLNGNFNTQGVSLPTSFTYGTTTNSGLGTPVSINSPINSSAITQDSVFITGLTANTLYTYQATDGVNSGHDVTFITAPNPPTVGTPNNPAVDGFTANWTAPAVPGTAPYTYTVQASADPTFATGVTTQTGIASGNTSFTFTTLSSATTYYYRVAAVNTYASSAWSATSTGIATDILPTAPCTTGTGSTTSTGAIAKSFVLPVIDGDVDPVWAGIPANNISNVSVGSSTGNTQTWKAMWSNDSLYFLVQVTDANLISQNITFPGSVAVAGATPSTTGNYYESDGVEITLDPDYSHGTSYDQINDVQFRFNLGATTVSGESSGSATQFSGAIFGRVASNIDFKVIPVTGGYNVEAAIPWGSDGANPGIDSIAGGYGTIFNGKNIGLEVQVNDANATNGRAAQYSWYNTSSAPYQDPSQFAKATLTTCPIPPTVILPTVTGIGSTTATLGATVTSSGDGTLTSRGTGYTTSPDATATGNALAEGGTGITIYSGPQRTGLLPQTKYYYLGYANNSNGETGVSTIDSFYTLSEIPTVQPTLSTSSCSQLTLNWTAVTFPPANQATQTGYLILRRQDGTNPTTTGISTRVATTQGALPAGTTLVATINSGATLTYTDATAVTGTTYNYLLVPFTWDGTAADSTYNYFTTGAASISGSPGAGLSAPTVTSTQPTCTVSTGTITVTAPTSGVTYSFDNGDTFGSNATSGNLGAGTYQVIVKSGSCSSPATPVIINTAPSAPAAPTVTIVQPTCTVATGTITVTAPTSGVTYSFDNGDTYGSNATSGNLGAGSYQVLVQASGCTSTATPAVINTQPATPVVTASPNQSTVSAGTTITLTGTSSVTGTYLWSSSPTADLSSPATLVTTATPAVTTVYTLTVTTTDGCNGSADTTVTINALPCPINPPRLITPNGDGHNDTWIINRGDCVESNIVNIYNRWGSLVYHSDDYQNDWGGTYKGDALPDGTYYYVILSTQNGVTYTLTGNITILR